MLASIVEVLPDPVVTVGLDGNAVYLNFLTSILRDLREQKAAESRLLESEAALRALNSQLEDRVAAFAAAMAPMSSLHESARRVLEEYGTRLPEGARILIAVGRLW